jgi:hypothetical protein
LNGANDFDSAARFALFVVRFNDFAKGALAQEFDHRV